MWFTLNANASPLFSNYNPWEDNKIESWFLGPFSLELGYLAPKRVSDSLIIISTFQ